MPNYGYTTMPVDAGMEMVGFLLLFICGVYLLMLAFLALIYVLQSVGLYCIAKRRCIKNPWLVWLPVGIMWILGSISDQYQYVVKGRVRNRRKWLLGLCLAIILISAPISGLVVGMLVQGNGYGVMMQALMVMLLSVLVCIVSVVAIVIEYTALYDVYMSLDPDNAVVYLVLSILFPIVIPFFLFLFRKRDKGMPPRKDEIPVAQVVEVVEEVSETAEEQ